MDKRYTNNPIISAAAAADPTVALFGGRYYIYPTDGMMKEPGFGAWSSPDLKEWTYEGPILKFADVAWAKKDAWAPDMVERNGKYYFYFSADSSIGVAVADSPTGPFTDPLGRPLIPFEKDMSTIDPCVFIDDDGETYLYWGATFSGQMFMRKLNPDMLSFAGEKITVYDCKPDEDYHCEGSYVFKRGGLYYYLWSEYIWCDAPGLYKDQSYRVNYAVADTPYGPFHRVPTRVPILSTDMELGYIGPGHNSVLHLPGTDEYFIVYHQHDGDAVRRRFANIDRLRFGPDGTLYTVRMTRTGVEARSISCYLQAEKTGPYAAGESLVFDFTVHSEAGKPVKARLLAGGQEVVRAGQADRLVWERPEKGFYKVWAEAETASGNLLVSAALNVDII
ncbi:MAG: family 43 glycosylhydrolase [Clostridiales bacterium]|nr:family 43 glycosylhydrolase [Clostridiales bacterium]